MEKITSTRRAAKDLLLVDTVYGRIWKNNSTRRNWYVSFYRVILTRHDLFGIS